MCNLFKNIFKKRKSTYVESHEKNEVAKENATELKKEDEDYNSVTGRCTAALGMLIDEKYQECYDIYAKSKYGLRPKDESILSTVCLSLGKYSECIELCNKLISYDSDIWNTDKILENNYISIAKKSLAFEDRISNIINNVPNTKYKNIEDIVDEESIEEIFNNGYNANISDIRQIKKVCSTSSNSEAESRYRDFAERLFTVQNYNLAAEAYLYAFEKNPQNDIYLGYCAQALYRKGVADLLSGDKNVFIIINSMIAAKYAIQINPNDVLWRILYINSLILVSKVSSIKLIRKAISEYNIAKKLDNPIVDNVVALNRVKKVLEMLAESNGYSMN
ncbi:MULTISPECIES: hypothetical protein [unclassified Clostridium]|uniref:hypothetical protein n=1 Tax=unclassified Clostridium TaxID=2614128 RepID=UPI00321644F7